jgi:cytochrome b
MWDIIIQLTFFGWVAFLVLSLFQLIKRDAKWKISIGIAILFLFAMMIITRIAPPPEEALLLRHIILN